jgi:hypothetical protein
MEENDKFCAETETVMGSVNNADGESVDMTETVEKARAAEALLQEAVVEWKKLDSKRSQEQYQKQVEAETTKETNSTEFVSRVLAKVWVLVMQVCAIIASKISGALSYAVNEYYLDSKGNRVTIQTEKKDTIDHVEVPKLLPSPSSTDSTLSQPSSSSVSCMGCPAEPLKTVCICATLSPRCSNTTSPQNTPRARVTQSTTERKHKASILSKAKQACIKHFKLCFKKHEKTH